MARPRRAAVPARYRDEHPAGDDSDDDSPPPPVDEPEVAADDASVHPPAVEEIEEVQGPAPQYRVFSREEEETMKAMAYIGYTDDIEQVILLDEFGTLDGFSKYSHSDIANIAKRGAKGNQDAHTVRIPAAKELALKQITDWVRDEHRLAKKAKIFGTRLETDKRFFHMELSMSYQRSLNRLKEKDGNAAQITAASPGKLVNAEKDWEKWSTGLKTMLTLMRGVTDVPLSYVIRDDRPNSLDNLDPDLPFDTKCIAMAKLWGPDFEADAKRVHLIIKGMVNGELADQLIIPGYTKENGREDFKTLKDHYDGDDKHTRRIHDAIHSQRTLIYRNERQMPFELFYSKAQHMWNIFARNSEPQTEPAKVRWLLANVTDENGLQVVKATINIQLRLDPDCSTWTFEKCAKTFQDHISTHKATAAPAKVSGVTSKKKGSNKNQRPDYDSNGVYIGSYSDERWQALSKEEKSKVHKARRAIDKAQGTTGPKAAAAPQKRSIQSLSKQLAAQAKTIAALQKNSEAASTDTSDTAPANNAGTAFGGRASKKTRISE